MTAVSRRRRLGQRLAALALIMTALMTFAPDAAAEPPQRVGWWNMLSAAGAAVPAPTTPAGGMHIAADSRQVLAYGAVLYSIPADTTAQLKLPIAGSQGTPQVEACPTKDTSWTAGDDQPSDSAPGYDCRAIHYPGSVSPDGTTITFDVTTVGASKGTSLSLAIVPNLDPSSVSAPGVSQPFSLDIDRPGARSLAVTGVPPPSAPPASNPSAFQPAAPTAPAAAAAGRPLGVPLPQNSAAGAPAAAPPGPAPQIATAAPPARPTLRSAARSTDRAGSTAGSVIGGLALVAALMFWGLGRGLLGGRIVPLSVPLVQRGPSMQR